MNRREWWRLEPKVADRVAMLAMLLNVLDLCISLHLFAVYPGLEEANPILDYMLGISEGVFTGTKLALGTGGVLLLRKEAKRGSKLASVALLAVTTVLGGVVVLGSWGLLCL